MKVNVSRIYNFQDPTIHNPLDPFEHDSYWTRIYLDRKDLKRFYDVLNASGGYDNFEMNEPLESLVKQELGEKNEETFIDVFLKDASPLSVGGFVKYIRTLE